MFSPPMWQPQDPELRLSVRRFQAMQVTEDDVDDIAMWTGGTVTDSGVTLAHGYPVPWGDWVYRHEGMFLGMADVQFQAEFMPA